MTTEAKKRKTSTPPEGYTCNLCGVSGHWIQQCPEKPKEKKRKSNHVPVPGVDPSQADIEKAREYQKIKPPNCFCGQPSRLKKVKRSNVKEDSRAVGKYFFFCSLKKNENPCRFARPVDEQLKDKKERICPFFAKNGKCKKGDKCMFSHELSRQSSPGKQGKSKGNKSKPVDEPSDKTDIHSQKQGNSASTNDKDLSSSDRSSKENSSSSDSSSDSDGSNSFDDGGKAVSNQPLQKSLEAHAESDDNSSSSSSSSSSED